MPETIRNFRRDINHLEYCTKLSTKYLSHFTPKFENLLNITKTGFRPSICNETQIYRQNTVEIDGIINWCAQYGYERNEDNPEEHVIYIPMVSFSDIPLKSASAHRMKYGSYCIALTKKWDIAHGLSPLINIPNNTEIHSIFRAIYEVKIRIENADKTENIKEHLTVQQLDRLIKYL